MSPRPLDPEDLRDEEPTETPSPAFTSAEARAAAEERAAVIVDAVGRGPALPCSAPSRLPYSRPRYGWSCDPDGPGCARATVQRRERRVEPTWHSPERDGARRLDGADLAAWARAERRGPAETWRYTGRVNVEPPPLREPAPSRGSEADLAAALSTLADVPRWVDPAERLERVRELVKSAAGLRRGTLLDALGAEP